MFLSNFYGITMTIWKGDISNSEASKTIGVKPLTIQSLQICNTGETNITVNVKVANEFEPGTTYYELSLISQKDLSLEPGDIYTNNQIGVDVKNTIIIQVDGGSANYYLTITE